ncbi:MAG: copper homeostasis periplasmic binding protein CopC [Rhodobacteraceae bacterium]|nr:copper homeostasis periplasmic binding protein CopC [Paracoccaceae bacterium]
MTMKTALILAASLAMTASAAFAHAHLTAEMPADKATVAAPTDLMLTFSEDVSLKFTGVKVTGPAKAEVAQGTPSLSQGDTVLTVPLQGTLGLGTYTVDWHALSTDGHKTHGTYTFTVK